MDAVADLTGFLSNRPGGVAYGSSTNTVYIAEFQDDPSLQVSIAALDVSTAANFGALTGSSTLTTPLGFGGLAGFDGFGKDPQAPNNFFGATAPDTANNANGAIIEFDSSGNPVATHFIGNFGPTGQPIVGLGIVQGATDSIMFVITENGREILNATLAGAAAAATSGEFTNQVSFVDRDPATGDIYVGVRGEPDRIQVFTQDSAGAYSFNSCFIFGTAAGGCTAVTDNGAPVNSNSIEGATLVTGTPGFLWVADNGVFPIKLRKINVANGQQTASIDLPNFAGSIGGVAHRIDDKGTASDTSDDEVVLYAYEQFNDVLHVANGTTNTFTQPIFPFDNNFFDQFFLPFGANGAVVLNVGGTDTLFIGRFNQLFELNPTTGELVTGHNTNLFDIHGLGTGGSILLGDRNFPISNVLGARLPGEPPAETTTIGAYTAQGRVTLNPTQLTPTASFNITKLSTVGITLTTPTEGQAFTASPITFSGSVDDPTSSVITVVLGTSAGVLVGAPAANPTGPSTFEDSADRDQYTTSGVAHFTNQFPGFSGQVLYFGKDEPSNPNFNTGGVTVGTADTPSIGVTSSTELVVGVWYNTEPGFDFDQKLFQFCTTGCTTFLQIVDIPSALAGFGGPPGGGGGFPPAAFFGGFFGTPGEVYAGPFGFDFAFVPINRFEDGSKKFTKIKKSLAQFDGQTGTVRIKLDSFDPIANDQEGMVVDNLKISGAKTTEQLWD